MNPDNISNNEISSYKLCERCKRNQAILTCPQCSPFHNFCTSCDTAVHALPSKTNHIRNPLDTFNVNNPIEKINNSNIINNNLNNSGVNNNNVNNNNYDNSTNYFSNSNLNLNNLKEQSFKVNQIPLSPNNNLNTNNLNNNNLNNNILNNNNLNNNNQLFYLPSSNLNYIEQPNRIRSHDFKQTFTKDYVTELNNIHLKEKNELLFKISSLENTLDRLKKSFGEHINKMQETVDDSNRESNKKIKLIEDENEIKLKKIKR